MFAAPGNVSYISSSDKCIPGQDALVVCLTGIMGTKDSPYTVEKGNIVKIRHSVTETESVEADYIFDNKVESIFNETVRPLVDSVLREGQNGLIMGTGASHDTKKNILFGDVRSNNKLGIIPAAITYAFEVIQYLENETPGTKFSVSCSLVEVYNNVVYDMLGAKKFECDINSETGNYTCVERAVSSPRETMYHRTIQLVHPNESSVVSSLYISSVLNGKNTKTSVLQLVSVPGSEILVGTAEGLKGSFPAKAIRSAQNALMLHGSYRLANESRETWADDPLTVLLSTSLYQKEQVGGLLKTSSVVLLCCLNNDEALTQGNVETFKLAKACRQSHLDSGFVVDEEWESISCGIAKFIFGPTYIYKQNRYTTPGAKVPVPILSANNAGLASGNTSAPVAPSPSPSTPSASSASSSSSSSSSSSAAAAAAAVTAAISATTTPTTAPTTATTTSASDSTSAPSFASSSSLSSYAVTTAPTAIASVTSPATQEDAGRPASAEVPAAAKPAPAQTTLGTADAMPQANKTGRGAKATGAAATTRAGAAAQSASQSPSKANITAGASPASVKRSSASGLSKLIASTPTSPVPSVSSPGVLGPSLTLSTATATPISASALPQAPTASLFTSPTMLAEKAASSTSSSSALAELVPATDSMEVLKVQLERSQTKQKTLTAALLQLTEANHHISEMHDALEEEKKALQEEKKALKEQMEEKDAIIQKLTEKQQIYITSLQHAQSLISSWRIEVNPGVELPFEHWSLNVDWISMSKADSLYRPFLSVYVVNENGLVMSQAMNTRVGKRNKSGSLIELEVPLCIGKPVKIVGEKRISATRGFYIFFELKHFKAYDNYFSTKCYTFLAVSDFGEGGTQHDLQFYQKPVNMLRRNLNNAFAHLRVTMAESK